MLSHIISIKKFTIGIDVHTTIIDFLQKQLVDGGALYLATTFASLKILFGSREWMSCFISKGGVSAMFCVVNNCSKERDSKMM